MKYKEAGFRKGKNSEKRKRNAPKWAKFRKLCLSPQFFVTNQLVSDSVSNLEAKYFSLR